MVFSQAKAQEQIEQLPTLVKEIEDKVQSLIKISDTCGDKTINKQRSDRASKILSLMISSPNEVLGFRKKPKYDKPSLYKDYIKNMEAWSLYNIDDYKGYIAFKNTINRLQLALIRHYVETLNLSDQESKKLANAHVELLLTHTLTAFDYLPITNNDVYQLRKAILENDNIENIIKFNNPDRLQNPYISTEVVEPNTVYRGHYYPSHTENESLLSIAVDYPEALEHLLKIGINPNHKNSFGKTPLMYAVQRGKKESVKILLEYGAKVNDVTKRVSYFNCNFYQLNQYNVTALHYAIRYSSYDTLELLLSSGADTNTKSKLQKEDLNLPQGTPSSWLTHFTRAKHREPSFKLDEIEIKALKVRL